MAVELKIRQNGLTESPWPMTVQADAGKSRRFAIEAQAEPMDAFAFKEPFTRLFPSFSGCARP